MNATPPPVVPEGRSLPPRPRSTYNPPKVWAGDFRRMQRAQRRRNAIRDAVRMLVTAVALTVVGLVVVSVLYGIVMLILFALGAVSGVTPTDYQLPTL
jgi:hypothetical protein